MSYSSGGRGYTQPPPGSQVRWGNPMTQGIRMAILFNGGGPGIVGSNGTVTHIFDSASSKLGRDIDPTITSALWTTTPYGMSLNFVAENNSYSFAPTFSNVQKWSTAFQFSIVTFGTYTIWSTDTNGIQVRFNASKVNILKAGVADMGSQSTTLSVNTYYHIGVSYDGTTLRFYLNGQPDGTATDTQTFTGAGLYVGGKNTTEKLGGNCKLTYLGIWDRVLSANDFRKIASSPYDLWAPAQMRRLFGIFSANNVIGANIPGQNFGY